MPHPPWQRWRRVVSRWPSLPRLDEYRKCQPCTAEAEDTCSSQRSSLSSFSTVCFSLGSLMRSRHYWKAPQEEGGKTLSLMSFNYFLFAFLGFFFSQQHPGNGGRAMSGSTYSLAGSWGGGWERLQAKTGIPLRLGSRCVVKTVDFEGWQQLYFLLPGLKSGATWQHSSFFSFENIYFFTRVGWEAQYNVIKLRPAAI